jgi:hypothetical protein
MLIRRALIAVALIAAALLFVPPRLFFGPRTFSTKPEGDLAAPLGKSQLSVAAISDTFWFPGLFGGKAAQNLERLYGEVETRYLALKSPTTRSKEGLTELTRYAGYVESEFGRVYDKLSTLRYPPLVVAALLVALELFLTRRARRLAA